MKKLLVTLITAMMILTFAIPATVAAADETGSITINGVGEEATYEVYKLLDLESYNTSSGAYSYKVNNEWSGFFSETTGALNYMTVAPDGYVTWTTNENDTTKADFAKLALAYAKEQGITPVKSSKNEGEFIITGTSGKFDDLTLGYYLIDSTVGALCGLTTTNPDASINAKNGKPTIDKQVQEDSTMQWGDTNTADIGQIVNFRVTVNVHPGAENYVLHDVMSDGLTLKEDLDEDFKVEHVDTSEGKVETAERVTDYEVVIDPKDGCTFEIVFTKTFCDHIETNDKVIVYYSAMLNRGAVIAGEGNPNEAWLEYGEDNNTTSDETITYTYGIDIVKTDSQNTKIDGAKFKIYDAEVGGNEVAVVLMDDGVTYRRARTDEEGVEIVVKNGEVRVVGFDNGTYYLEETEAPDGYNKLTARQKFIIADENLDSVYNGDIYSTGSGVHVVNKSGSMLPETGGFGSTMMLLFGGLVVLAAGVILFARKRMSQYAE